MIIQINTWICEVCGRIVSEAKEVDQFNDPLIISPEGEEWDYFEKDGKEFLACPKCFGLSKLKKD